MIENDSIFLADWGVRVEFYRANVLIGEAVGIVDSIDTQAKLEDVAVQGKSQEYILTPRKGLPAVQRGDLAKFPDGSTAKLVALSVRDSRWIQIFFHKV